MSNRIFGNCSRISYDPAFLLIITFFLFLAACSDKETESIAVKSADSEAFSVSRVHSSLVSSQQVSADQLEKLKAEIKSIEAETSQVLSQVNTKKRQAPSQSSLALKLSDLVDYSSSIPYADKLLGVGRIAGAFGFTFVIVNGLIWCRIKRRVFYQEKRVPLLLGSLILLLMYYSPVVAADVQADPQEIIQKTDAKEETEKLNETLSEAIAMLESNDLQRSILILEGNAKRKNFVPVYLPKISTSNALLQPQESIKSLGINYHYTLASLYEENGQREKAVENLQRMLSIEKRSYSQAEADLSLKAIMFLIDNNETTLVKEKIGLVIRRINDGKVLAALSEKLLSTKFSADAQRAFARTIKITKNVDDLIATARTLFGKGLTEEGTYALEVALQKRSNIGQLASIIELATSNQLATVTTQAVNKAILTISPSSNEFAAEFEKIYGLLLRKNELGAAVQFYQGTINNVIRDRNNRELRLLELSAIAAKHSQIDHARAAVQKLEKLLGPSSTSYPARTLGVVEKEDELLRFGDIVSLKTLSATLSEASLRNEEAHEAYLTAGTARIQQIIDSYGQEGVQWLSDFILARDAFERAGDEETVNQLDTLYMLLMVEKEKNLDFELQQELAELNKIKQEKQQELSAALSDLHSIENESESFLKEALLVVRFVALGILYLITLVVTIHLAYNYCMRFNSFRLTAFVGKFVEVSGWTTALSVVGIIPGILAAWAGQAILLLHRSAFESESFVTEEELMIQREGANS